MKSSCFAMAGNINNKKANIGYFKRESEREFVDDS